MMRAAVLPQSRERLWGVVASRLDVIESGLELVLEGFDCSRGQHGLLDGLARDCTGAPVLIALAVSGDVMLVPRIVSATEFLERVGDGLATAVPEGSFCSGATPRVLVITTEVVGSNIPMLLRLGLPALEVCRLEPFRLAGSERFAVRWIESVPAINASAACAPVGDVPVSNQVIGNEQFVDSLSGDQGDYWEAIARLCERLDPGVRIDGDRFRRRITWHGRSLGQALNVEGALRAIAADGSEHAILSKADVRAFGDLLVRQYAELAGLRIKPTANTHPDGEPAAKARPTRSDRLGSGPPKEDSLRSAMADALLSPEEFAALAGPADPSAPNDPPD